MVLTFSSIQLQLCQPKHELTDEGIKPYLTVSHNINSCLYSINITKYY